MKIVSRRSYRNVPKPTYVRSNTHMPKAGILRRNLKKLSNYISYETYVH